MTKVNKISDLAFILISFCASGWSAYWSQKFFTQLIDYRLSWVIAVLIFGFCSHIFVNQGIKDLLKKKDYLSPSLLLFLIIFSAGVYIDLSGIDFHSYETEVKSTKDYHLSLIESKQKEIDLIKEDIQKNKNWNENNRPNWSMHKIWIDSKKELEILRSEIDSLREIAQIEINDSKAIADQKSNDLSGGVIIAYLLLIISNLGLIKSEFENESIIEKKEPIIQPIIQKTLIEEIKKEPIIEEEEEPINQSIIEKEDKRAGFIINQPKKTKSISKEKFSYINDFPKTIDLLISGKSIREAIEEGEENCTYYKARKIKQQIKNV